MTERQRIVVRGTVQGVGFRPHVYRLAQLHAIAGWVANTSEGVVVEAEGQADALRTFVSGLSDEAPPLAVVDEIEASNLPPTGQQGFSIRPSESLDGQFVPISPDVATCGDCLRELLDPADRRYRYAFTNCTNCGPRFTIVQDIPYDRPRTTMRDFPMCPDCSREYHDPTDRRFHAQPNACPTCGPKLWIVDREGRPVALDGADASGDPSFQAIRAAARLLAEGEILAIRGVGGFHLACDATNVGAVAKLRERKRRVDKPFAVMSPDLNSVRAYCQVSEVEARLLETATRPIVLLERREPTSGASGCADHSEITAAVAPRNRNLGVMLPYAPLHHLLLREFATTRPGLVALVMTSGNLSEEPIATSNAEALERLRDLADYFLLHDREIETRCDDSVARVFRDRPMLLRRSRGYAPAPVRLGRDLGAVLACGAELKNTFCLTRGSYAFLSQHIGDLENYETEQSYRQAIAHFERLFRVEPEVVAHDLHPDYLSTVYARERVEGSGGRLRAVAVQHHQAHVASCMIENHLDGLVIGVAFDGTGYGEDGAIWGGELFVGGYDGFQRAGHLAYLPLPGGDLAVRRPIRMALSYLWQAYGEDGFDLPLPSLGSASPEEKRFVRAQLVSGLNAPPTSSVGRLFDGVAALVGVRDAVNYEGQAAIELEALANEASYESYDWHPDDRDGELIFDPAPLVRQVVDDVLADTPASGIAARFHNAVARAVVAACAELRERSGLERVCLSGGVFQNAYLLGRVLDGLERAGLTAYTHRLLPPNDGGIALGQAAIAAYQS